jgi:CheY-like chemotaxis protein
MSDAVVVTRSAPKMLIADDDPAVVRLLADWSSKAGFEVDTAADGLQALIKANRNHPDILVIDFNMPGADGLSVCAQLLEKDRHPLNVVLITANEKQENLERCEGFGVSYVRKGPEFWTDFVRALSVTFPLMADKLNELGLRPRNKIINSRPRILIIDEDPSVKGFLSSRFNKYSVDGLFALSALLGFRIARREQPNIIVSNYSLPDGDIYYLLTKLRTTPLTEKVPVIVWTRQKLTETDRERLKREVCGHPGAAQILHKSSDAAELFTTLQPLIAFDTARSNFKTDRTLYNHHAQQL